MENNRGQIIRKVMVFVPQLKIGGGQRMAVEIIRYIRKKNTEIQFRILVLGRRYGTVLEQTVDEENIDVVYLGKEDGFRPQFIFKIYRAIKDFNPDVIHAHLPRIHYLLLPMVLCRVPVRYYTVHNLAERDIPNKILRKIADFSFHHCHVQPIAVSEICRRSITTVYKIPAEFIYCVNVGIDLKRFRRPDLYENLDVGVIRFIAVGRFMAQKNYMLMIDAFAALHKKIPRTELVILGDGELRGELQRELCKLGLTEAVKLLGIIEDVNRELWKAHIYLLSSDYEGLPQSVLEAMAAGLPIVSTKAGGVVDVVENEGNGFLVDIGDEIALTFAMTRLAEDKKLREAFSARSEQLSKQYSIKTCAEKYLVLYLK